MRPEQIKELIETNLPESKAMIEGDDGKHFTAIVISSRFENKNRIQKQQLVYATLGRYIGDGSIHAISIKTFTPEEWHKHNQEQP